MVRNLVLCNEPAENTKPDARTTAMLKKLENKCTIQKGGIERRLECSSAKS